jgi:ureidoacrylate peracid hydrolase
MTKEIPSTGVALVLIDMQNAFCHPDGSFGQVGIDVSGCRAAIGGCVRLVEAARQAKIPVIFTRAIHERGLAEWNVLRELPVFEPLRKLDSCLAGSWDADLVDELVPASGEAVLDKSRYSPFVETDIEQRLHELGAESVVIGGVGTSVCLESAVRDASQRGFYTFIVEDATGDISEEAHTGSLHLLGTMFGWTTNSHDVADAWARP